ncbi:MAG: efflux RND transporter periplasmic adaptor subunit [Gemmatimonadales bacterium]
MQRWMMAVGGAIVALGCRQQQAMMPPPPEVEVVTVTPQRVEEVFEFSGEVEASKSVQVRSQVSGVIVARPFREGQAVQAGQVLYRIEPVSYEADWRAAQGRLAEAKARQSWAQQNLQRYTALLKDNAISRQDYDNAVTQAQQADAAVEAAQGAADRARKALDDATVRAEIPGRVGEALLEVGARVRGPEDVLTTIDVLDPIYVSFRPSSQQLLSWKRDPETSRLLVPGGPLRFEAILPDGKPAPTQGRLGFVDPVLDPTTGTQQFRATFPNPQPLLLPGQFVRIRMSGISRDSAMVIPQRAVLQGMGRQSVYVVVAGDTVKPRDVVATGWQGGNWLIEQGLAPGDRVIVEGVQKVGPGMVVRPVPAGAPTAGDSAARRLGGSAGARDSALGARPSAAEGRRP